MLLCVAMLLGVVMLSACDKNTNDNASGGDDDRSTDSGVTVQAVRLKNSLEKGEIISAKDIEVVDEKESNLPEGYIAKRVDVIGKKILETAEKGAYLAASMIEGGVSDDKESNEIHKNRFKSDEYWCFDIKYRMTDSRIYSISKIRNVSLNLQDDME